jgi:hypothetical protein
MKNNGYFDEPVGAVGMLPIKGMYGSPPNSTARCASSSVDRGRPRAHAMSGS